jgi:putative ABC transport system permease protein
MLSNYLRTAIRQVSKYRSSVTVNVLGLAFGLACCMMCFVHLQYQLSFDTFHENEKDLFRIITGDATTSHSWVKVSSPIPPKLKSDVPEILNFCRFASVSFSEKVAVESDGQTFLEPAFMMADPSFFQMFSFPMVKGSSNLTLDNVVITESVAHKLFGNEDPIGKIIRLKDNQLDFPGIGSDERPTAKHTSRL